MALKLSIKDHEINMLVCIDVLLVVWVRLLMKLNMNKITKKHMLLQQFVIVYDCSPNAFTPMWLRPKDDKISLQRLMIKSMKMQIKTDEQLYFWMVFVNIQHCTKEIWKKINIVPKKFGRICTI